MRLGALAALCVALASGCAPQERDRSTAPPPLKEAKGHVTVIDSSNAPKVVPLAPPLLVKAAPFQPTQGGPGHGAVAHTRTWTTDDGLAMDDILCGYRDAKGMLWFGTNGGGVSLYDGHTFTNYTMANGLPDNVILTIGGDSKGNIWIGTSTGGLCKYDGRTFTPIPLNDATGLERGITGMVETADGALWFGTRGRGIYRYDGEHYTNYTKADGLGYDHVRGMALDKQGSLWVIDLSAVTHFDGQRFVELKADDGTALAGTRAITVTDDGAIWFGTANGVIRYNTADGGPHIERFPVLADGPVEVWDITSAGEGAVWIATATQGAIRFEPRKDAAPLVEQFTTASGLPGNEVLSLVKDRAGDVWFGTRGAGVCHYRGPAFATYRSIRPISVAEDRQGTLWAGTAVGIARLDANGFSEQKYDGSLPWNYSVHIDPRGRMGFGVNMADADRQGISWLDGSNYEVMTNGATHADVFWAQYDSRGRLWTASRKGVDLFDDGRSRTFNPAQGLGRNTALCLHEARDGAMWVGLDGGGLSRIEVPDVDAGGSITTWTTAEGLPSDVVWTIDEDSGGTLWIATLGGLCRYDGRSFLAYTTQEGMPDDNVYQALVSREGGVLIGTLKGLAILTGWENGSGGSIPFGQEKPGASNEEVGALKPVFETYNSATGFPVKDVQTAEHALFEDSNGILWIATGSDKTGLVRFDRKALRRDPQPLQVQLVSVSLNNEPMCWYELDGQADSATVAQQEVKTFGHPLTASERNDARSKYQGVRFNSIARHFPLPEGLVLNYRNNRIGFEFVGIETARPEVVEYQYMLEGYDRQWSLVTRATSTSYGNIREGDYSFKVKAKSPGGVWSEPVEYRFSVLPPIHRTWWAIVLYVLACAGAVLFYVRWRTASLKRQHRKLARLVAVRTEELSRKKQEADAQRSRAELSERAKEQFLANMSHEIRTPMNAIMGMSDILRDRPHTPEQAKYLNAIAQSSENLLVIINDILDLSKIDAGRIDFEHVPFDVRALMGTLQTVVQVKADQKRLPVEVRVADDVPGTLLGDPTRLNQIVLNLAGNAVKFTEQGSITIAVSVADRSADRCTLVIDVIDTGIGIPEDRIEKVFEEFTQAYSDTTRKYGGTGLGLTISRRLAQLQGGSVTVKSVRDKGSTFTVSIPFAIGNARAPEMND